MSLLGSSHANLRVLGSNPACSGSPPLNDRIVTEHDRDISPSKPSNRRRCSTIPLCFRSASPGAASSACTSLYLARSSSAPRAFRDKLNADINARMRDACPTVQRLGGSAAAAWNLARPELQPQAPPATAGG